MEETEDAEQKVWCVTGSLYEPQNAELHLPSSIKLTVLDEG